MKKSLFILFLLLSAVSSAQSFIQYGATVKLGVSYRLLTNSDDQFAVNNSIIDSRNDLENPALRSAIGFNFKYNFNERIGLKSGILYAIQGYNWKGDFTLFNTSGILETVLIRQKEFHHYASIPVLFAYSIVIANAVIELNSGVNLGFYVQSNYRTKYSYSNGNTDKSKSSQSNYSRFQGQATLGANYIISRKNEASPALRIGPYVNYSFTPILSTPIKEYPFSIGINVGLLFGGKK
jgi:Outer membrane protein beta-barrel domain